VQPSRKEQIWKELQKQTKHSHTSVGEYIFIGLALSFCLKYC